MSFLDRNYVVTPLEKGVHYSNKVHTLSLKEPNDSLNKLKK